MQSNLSQIFEDKKLVDGLLQKNLDEHTMDFVKMRMSQMMDAESDFDAGSIHHSGLLPQSYLQSQDEIDFSILKQSKKEVKKGPVGLQESIDLN